MISSINNSFKDWHKSPVLENLSSSIRALASRVASAVCRFFKAAIRACQSKEGLKDFLKQINILRLIRGISQEDRNKSVEQINQLFPQSEDRTKLEDIQSEHVRKEIIQIPSIIPKKDRSEFVEQVSQLFIEHKNRNWGQDREEIIQALSPLSKEDRKDVVDRAKQLIPPEDFAHQYFTQTIRNLAGKTVEERERYCKLLKPFS
jgi:DnaJ-domain-containing protein 1